MKLAIRDIKGQGRFYTQVGWNSIAQLNRHTGAPHEHKRESSRRIRQGCVA
jgi:hypothetical protein